MDQDRSSGGIAELGVFCGVCHRRNDGASDFCACQESLVGYRPLNAKHVASWLTVQLRERDAAGVPTSEQDAEMLRSWAGDPRSSIPSDDGNASETVMVAVGIGCGAPLSILGIVGIFAVYGGVADMGAMALSLMLFPGVPLLAVGIVGLASSRWSKPPE